MTLGSLFDGIGGFPLAATRAGIVPVWASEIEKAPISITKRHFPDMRHLGDIKKLHGADIKPVDIITFGSPCQDLSVSGNRVGLKGKRSGLFMQAVRIVKEMRVATNNTCPARIVWENVTGAFSTNDGGDFRTVIEEIAGIAEQGISIPQPSGRWLAAGAVLGDCFSIAWRVFDAQYWGVPQQRRRIFLVADFGSDSAGKILFKSESGLGDYQAGEKSGDSFAGNVGSGIAQSEKTCRIKVDCYADNVPFVGIAFGAYAQRDIGKTILAEQDPVSGDLVVCDGSARRLMPIEYERLQGYPDNWTKYGHNGKEISDYQRYKALGNSVAIPCVQFIIEGIKQIKNEK